MILFRISLFFIRKAIAFACFDCYNYIAILQIDVKVNCDRSNGHEVFIHHANCRTLRYLHPLYAGFVWRRARSRSYPHWGCLGDSGGRSETSGRKNQEWEVYQEVRRKRKMSRRLYQRL